MDEKELDEKLRKINKPDIELPGHRAQLKHTLMEAYDASKQRRGLSLPVIRNWLKHRAVDISSLFKPGRPVWQPALAASLILALVMVLSIAVPVLLNQAQSKVQLVRVDDWQFTGIPAIVPSTSQQPATGSSPPPVIVVPPAVTLTQPPSAGNNDNIGFSTGGAKDINNFRQNIQNGYLPLPTDITCEGLFYDYYFDTGQADECRELFCPSYSYAVTRDPLSGEVEYYLSVGLNSGMKESDFQRKKLNLVIVLDISGSMSSSFNHYYYDQYGNISELDEEEKAMAKIQAATQSIAALLDHLEDDDRVGMVLFNGDAFLAKPLNPVAGTDMTAIKEHILQIEAGGSTNLKAGMEMASAMFADYPNSNPKEYENRIIFITDAMPNTGDTGRNSFLDRLAENSGDNLYTTFIGIGVDFNSALVEYITGTRGANYYSVHSPGQFKERMDEEFEYMVTPLVFDLQLNLEAEGWRIEEVYGSQEADEATGELMKINTLFPSKRQDGQTKGGLVLLKLEKTAENSSLELRVSYEDRSGKLASNQTTVELDAMEPEFFANSGIRKGVLLTRYADLARNWIIDERQHAHISYPWEPRINREEGIISPPTEPGEWERQSLPLYVSPPYRQIFEQFSAYFEAEAGIIGDENLVRELDILAALAGFEETR
ncbi:MAG: VWA domain-containing protein [Dehalococcoidaceae bacterium]|nr:VWA domain-containing protein [Dehalococcoidaceae bacterium]